MAVNNMLRVFVWLPLSICSVIASAQNVADLSVVVSGPHNATFGDRIVYSVTVTNNGPNAASNVVLNIGQLPFPFGSIDNPCSAGFPCSLGSLDTSQSLLIPSIAIQTPYLFCPQCNDPFPLIVSASVTSDTPDSDTVNNRAVTFTSVLPVRSLPVVPVDADWVLLVLSVLLGCSAVFNLRDRRL